MKSTTRSSRVCGPSRAWLALWGSALVQVAAGGLTFGGQTSGETGAPEVDRVGQVLAAAFRIDIARIDVVYDLDFEANSLAGHAKLFFRMRPGERTPLFHFDPSIERGTVRETFTAMRLDGEEIDFESEAELALIRVPGSPVRSFEIQRQLSPHVEHELEIAWELTDWRAGRGDRFETGVDDVTGDGNERLWPTINSPEELARHRIELRIHDPRDFVVVGSGTVLAPRREATNDVGVPQIFRIDSGRDVASYTMMVAALPAADARVDRFEVTGVEVTLASEVSGVDESDATEARTIIERTLPRLAQDFGPYPAAGLQVFLKDWDDGMEYYGATITGIDALEHELVHMYWGCSVIGRTWRDTWLDEAVAVWWTHRDDDHDPTHELADDFASRMVSGRSLIEPAFDLRAYDEGASMIARAAVAMGGDEAMLEFLRAFHAEHAFVPFSTDEFVGDLVAASENEALGRDFQRWLQAPRQASPRECFDALWEAFQQNYAFFELRGVDWSEERLAFRPRIRDEMSDGELFEVLCEMLRSLDDAHVTLEREDGSEFSAETPPRFYTEFRDDEQRELARVTRETLAAAGFGRLQKGTRILRSCVSERFGYVRIRSFSGPSKRRLAKALDEMLDGFAELDGVIIDVRDNPGGEDSVAYAIAARFTDRKRLGHTKRTKLGPGAEAYGEPQSFWLEPAGALQFTGPVVLLTHGASYSAADVFALAMDQLPHVWSVGEPTNGVFSDVLELELPNGWSYTLSNQRYCAPDGTCYEGRGVPVDVRAANTLADLETREDAVLAAGLRLLEQKCAPAGADAPSGE